MTSFSGAVYEKSSLSLVPMQCNAIFSPTSHHELRNGSVQNQMRITVLFWPHRLKSNFS